MTDGETTEAELRDGTTISLRPVRPADKGVIAQGFDRLSPESRYRRFFTAMNRLSDTDLKYLTEVDHHDHEAVLAFGPGGDPVGVARYVRTEAPGQEAEVAVAVVDGWQGRGAGTALLERLVERAREEGVERFAATVLASNEEAIELFRSFASGDAAPRPTGGGQVELKFDLPRGGVEGTLLGRALRSAAAGGLELHPWRLLKDRLQALGEGRPPDPPGRENRPDR